jgi:hypothetical protein
MTSYTITDSKRSHKFDGFFELIITLLITNAYNNELAAGKLSASLGSGIEGIVHHFFKITL